MNAGLLSLCGVAIIGISSWLGKVWATRIARKESAKTEKELIALRSKMESTSSMIETTLSHAQAGFLELRIIRFDALCEVWKFWLEIKNITSSFLLPYEILSYNELQKSEMRKKVFPYEIKHITDSQEKYAKLKREIEKLRPIIPEHIYFHLDSMLLLHGRIMVKWAFPLDNGTPSNWHLSLDNSELDSSVRALMEHAKTQNFKLSDPRTSARPAGELSVWKLALDNQLIALIYEEINNPTAAHIKIHRSLQEDFINASIEQENLMNEKKLET